MDATTWRRAICLVLVAALAGCQNQQTQPGVDPFMRQVVPSPATGQGAPFPGSAPIATPPVSGGVSPPPANVSPPPTTAPPAPANQYAPPGGSFNYQSRVSPTHDAPNDPFAREIAGVAEAEMPRDEQSVGDSAGGHSSAEIRLAAATAPAKTSASAQPSASPAAYLEQTDEPSGTPSAEGARSIVPAAGADARTIATDEASFTPRGDDGQTVIRILDSGESTARLAETAALKLVASTSPAGGSIAAASASDEANFSGGASKTTSEATAASTRAVRSRSRRRARLADAPASELANAMFAGESRSTSASWSATRPEGDSARSGQVDYAHYADYSQLRGRLEYLESARQWKLRYIPIDGQTDDNGGSVVLAAPPPEGKFQPGDAVVATGRPTAAAAEGFAPLYQWTAIEKQR